MLTMFSLLNQPLAAAKVADAERAGRRAPLQEPREHDSRRALLLQLARGRRAPRPAHA
jgi:hypothetical protein